VSGIPPTVDLFGVWGTSTQDFWVVGADNGNHGFAAHWTGSAFTISSSLTTAPLRGVWGSGAGVMVAGDAISNYGSALYFKGAWNVLPQATILSNRSVLSVWYDENLNEYTLQTNTNIMARSLSPGFNSAVDIGGSQIPGGAGPCFAMHARFAACANGVYAPFGQSTLFPSTAARAIHVSNPSIPLLFVAGTAGYLARYSANGFQTLAGAPAENLEGVWSSATGEVIAVGTNGTMIGVAGLDPTPTVTVVKPVTNANLHAVTAVGILGNRYLLAVGDKGTVLTWKF
jgi:hypothetical protein